MSLNRVTVWSLLEVLTATALNNEFQNIVDFINNTVLGPTSHVHDGADAAQISYGDILDKPSDKNAFIFPITGTPTVGTNKAPLLHEMWENGTIIEVRVVCKTAPTGANVIIDVNVDGVSIWDAANRVKVLAGANAGNTGTINNPVVAKGSILTIDVDQIGSSVAGSDFTVIVIYQTELSA
jgi:hypothetical protein